MTYIIIILVVMWLISYIKFRRRYKMDKMMCEFTRHRYEEDSRNPMTAIEYASSLMQCQQYGSAIKVFEGIRNRIPNANKIYPFLDANIEFCKKPLPWSSGAKDGAKDHKGGSWWHNFQLVRFGGRRQVAISEQTGLAFNSMLRMMNR